MSAVIVYSSDHPPAYIEVPDADDPRSAANMKRHHRRMVDDLKSRAAARFGETSWVWRMNQLGSIDDADAPIQLPAKPEGDWEIGGCVEAIFFHEVLEDFYRRQRDPLPSRKARRGAQ
jgi:hypothetical protein